MLARNANDDTGVKDFTDGKNIAGDRCASWIDGRFLQGTFTGTRTVNDARPDVNFVGARAREPLAPRLAAKRVTSFSAGPGPGR